MTNIKLSVAYDGEKYCGFQVQPGLPTIQGVLEEQISALAGERIRVNVSGRTDAGVHALGQVVNFTVDAPIPPENWKSALNSRLPGEIRITEAVEVPLEFHARYSAKSKRYRYLLVLEDTQEPIVHKYSWVIGRKLDYQRMKEAAQLLLGEHDFRAFQTSGSSAKTTIRRISQSEVSLLRMLFPPGAKELETVSYDVTADGFLYNMVRNIVGWLVQVGKGELTLEEARQVLESKDRSLVGKSAPPRGLWLMDVQY